METIKINGKAIYSPKGKAGEYAKYACNFYVGCSNDCEYCYCKKGVLSHAMGKPTPTLKKCFKNEEDAMLQFEKELHENLTEFRKHGIFLTFSSDPLLPETRGLTYAAMDACTIENVPIMLLTKRADFDIIPTYYDHYRNIIAIGFTLTGMDNLEPNASTNAERIYRMKDLAKRGYKTFASIEPVIDVFKSERMIEETLGYCDMYKIDLMSGKKDYIYDDVYKFTNNVNSMILEQNIIRNDNIKVYWKQSVLHYLWPNNKGKLLRFGYDFCVDADYNLFNH